MPSRRPGNIPAETDSFVGRRREVGELRKQLSAGRLITLVGPGGVGKTRLALRLASELKRGFRDGAWLVPLAEIQQASIVSKAVMTALDLRDQAATEPRALLLRYLKDKVMLLVIDNCEHLLGTVAPLVGEVIGASPGVRVVATSREPLRVPGEQLVPVPPLRLPDFGDSASLAELRTTEAVRLFIERAAAATGAYELTESNCAAVIDICRRLDGLPLAIELAAVRTRVLSAEQIRDRLADRFRLLNTGDRATPPRQRTLQAALDWSYDPLTAAERSLLMRLSVFGGRFTLDDIDSTCISRDVSAADVLDLLASLVDKSLVIKEDVGAIACYRLHETLREYAAVKLGEAGEEESTVDRLIAYYRLCCLRSAAEAAHRRLEWLRWADLEMDNVRTVLRRCLARRDLICAYEIAGSLGWYWMTRATAEGVGWLDELLASGRGEALAQARVSFIRAYVATLQGSPTAARPAADRAIGESRNAGDATLLCQSLAVASVLENLAGDRMASRGMLDELQMIARGRNDPDATLALIQARTYIGLFEGDLDAVRIASAEGVRVSRDAGDPYNLLIWLINLGSALLMAGDLMQAESVLKEAMGGARRIDDRMAQAYLLDALGCVQASFGRAGLAAQLLGAADRFRSEAGARVSPILAPLRETAEAAATTSLGSSKFQHEYRTGGQLERDAAISLARGEPAQAPAVKGAGQHGDRLGKREAEVARLIAEGLSNKEIGARLFISERTVEGHVRNVLNKLGFNTRAEIAGWVAARAT